MLTLTQRGYFKLFKKYSPLLGNYIEIGPDIGLFTENCIKEGQFEKLWLFEPNQAIWHTLESKIAGSKYELCKEMFALDNIPDHSASSAVLIQVLDHLLNPLETLIQMRKKLTNNSILLLVTHDESSLLSKSIGDRWPPFCLQHPQLFNPKTITHLLDSAGYKVLGIHKTYNYFPFMYLLKHLLWAFGIQKVTLPEWEQPCVPLKLGNILTIATPLS